MKASFFKKAFALCMCCAMLFSVLVFSAEAADTATVTTTGDKELYATGETVVITASYSGSDFQTMSVAPTYDKTVFEFVSGQWLLSNAVIKDVLESGERAVMTFSDDTAVSGAVFELTLKVISTSECGNATVYLNPSVKAKGDVAITTVETPATVMISATHLDSEWIKDASDHSKICPTCGCYSVEVTPHTYGAWITESGATTSETGSKYRVCTECQYREDKVIPQNLKFASASLTLASSIIVDFKVSPDYFTVYGYTNPYVNFKMNLKDDENTVIDLTVTEYTVEESTGRYVFSFDYTTPYLMNETITAVLYAEIDSEVYESAPQEYSIATYCYNQLKKTAVAEDVEFRTLIVDLLNYGAESQKVFGYDEENLVNAALTDEQAGWATATEPALSNDLNTSYETVTEPTAAWKSAGLELSDAVEVRLQLEATDLTDLTVKIEGFYDTWEIPASEFVKKNDADNRYYIYFSDLYSFQMREPFSATVMKNGAAVSNTLRYSIVSYAYSKANDATYGDLVISMMKYGDSAYNYFYK